MPTKGGRRRAGKQVSVGRAPGRFAHAAVASTAPAKSEVEPHPVAPGKHRFWLVQRMEQRTRPDRTGLDSKFVLDYMGSAEFEFGAVPKSLKRIRAVGDVIMVAAEMTRENITKTVYFVAPREGMDDKLADFQVWFGQPRLMAKDWTDFDLLFTENFGWRRRESIHTDAWWSLRDDIAWALNENVAKLLLEGFMPPTN